MLKPQKISEEQKKTLTKLGLKEYKGRTVYPFFRPDNFSYWLLHGGLLFASVRHRFKIGKFAESPKFLSSAASIALLYSVSKDLYRNDYAHMFMPWRPMSIEDHLETSPITRNAYYKALHENKIF